MHKILFEDLENERSTILILNEQEYILLCWLKDNWYLSEDIKILDLSKLEELVF